VNIYKPIRKRKYNFKVGLIGCGNIAHTQLKYIDSYLHKENIALCDPDRIRMKALSRRFGISNLYEDADQLLGNFSPDIVHILTPPQTHLEIVIRCLKKGAHLFIEKPMCVTRKEAEIICRVADETKRSVCIDHLLPFDPLITRAKKWIDADRIGKLTKIYITDLRDSYQQGLSDVGAKWLKSLPGGLLFDLLPHHLSIFNFFAPELKFAEATCRRQGSDITEIKGLFSSADKVGQIRIDIDYPAPGFTVNLIGVSGSILLDFRNRSLESKPLNSTKDLSHKQLLRSSAPGPFQNKALQSFFKSLVSRNIYVGMHYLIGRFYQSISDSSVSPVSPQSGLIVMEQMDTIFKAIDGTGSVNTTAIPPKITRHGGTKADSRYDTLVTGASGFIGRALIKRLVESGNGVRAAVHSESDRRNLINRYPGQIDAFCGDISDGSFVEYLLAGVKTVYHLAAATSGGWLQHIDASVKGTQNLMSAALKARCEKIVYVSTIALLDQSTYPDDKVIDETFPYEKFPEKRDPYCFAKLWAERIVKSFLETSSNQTILILRPGIVYGPEKIPIDNLVQRHGKLWILKGGRRKLLPLVYIDNLVDALILAGKASKSGIYNVIDEEDIELGEFVNAYKDLTHSDSKTLYLAKPLLLAFHQMVAVIRNLLAKPENHAVYKLKCKQASVRHSSRNLKRELGWRQNVAFKKGLKTAVQRNRVTYG